MINISRDKDYQKMQLGWLIEYNRNIFLEKSNPKYNRETISKPFSEKPKLSRSLDQLPKVFSSLFLLYAKLKTIEIYRN